MGGGGGIVGEDGEGKATGHGENGRAREGETRLGRSGGDSGKQISRPLAGHGVFRARHEPRQLLRVMCLEKGAETRLSGQETGPAGSRHVSLPLARRHTLTAALLTLNGASRGASLVRHQCMSDLIGSRVVDTHRDNVVALDEWEALVFCVVRLNM